MSKITISRIHTFIVNVPVSTIFYYIPGIHFNEHIWFRESINWWSKSTKNAAQGCWWNHSIISLTNMYIIIDMIWYDPWGTMHLLLLHIFLEVCCCKVAHFIKIYMFLRHNVTRFFFILYVYRSIRLNISQLIKYQCIVFWCIIRHCIRLCLGIWGWWIQNQKYVMHANFQQWKENHWCYSTSQQAERCTI